MNVAILDYGIGNLHSLGKALALPGVTVRIEADPTAAIQADALVLPGVGAFAAAAERLAPAREQLREALVAGLPCLGVCLGMQLLFDASDEGAGRGLELIAGRVERLRARRVPQIGWNAIEWTQAEEGDPLLAGRPGFAWYANGFVCRPRDARVAIAWSRHEDDRFVAAVRVGRTVGVQFHPEKSGRAGVRFIGRWLASVAAPVAQRAETR